MTGTIQQATYPIVVSAASVGKSSNMPDNVLPSDMSAAQVTVVQPAGAQGPCTPNAAQFDSVGKSLAPQHE